MRLSYPDLDALRPTQADRGGTRFFRSCSLQCANSRLNASTTTHGYDQQLRLSNVGAAAQLTVSQTLTFL